MNLQRVMPMTVMGLGGILAALFAACVLFAVPAPPAQAQTNVAEAGSLGSVTVTVGDGGSDSFGYSASPSYGTLVSGQWPADLFTDGTARTVSLVREGSDGNWDWRYSGGTADDWLADQATLDKIEVTVTYASGADTRTFILGGFIEARPSGNTLELDPPLPSRDWDDRAGEDVTFEFRWLDIEAAPVIPAALTPPTGESGSLIDFLNRTVPGGTVTFQTMVTIIVFTSFVWKAPATPFGILMSAIVLMLTPWGPVIIGYGDTLAASAVVLNVACGAYAYKSWVARTES